MSTIPEKPFLKEVPLPVFSVPAEFESWNKEEQLAWLHEKSQELLSQIEAEEASLVLLKKERTEILLEATEGGIHMTSRSHAGHVGEITEIGSPDEAAIEQAKKDFEKNFLNSLTSDELKKFEKEMADTRVSDITEFLKIKCKEWLSGAKVSKSSSKLLRKILYATLLVGVVSSGVGPGFGSKREFPKIDTENAEDRARIEYEKQKKALEANIDPETLQALAASPDAQAIYRYTAGIQRNVMIVDKRLATNFVINKDHKLIVATPVGMGKIKGNQINPGLGPDFHAKGGIATTPAGRYILGYEGIPKADLEEHNDRCIRIYYEAASEGEEAAMWLVHTPDVTGEYNTRSKKLQSKDIKDNFFSEGCINMFADLADWDAYMEDANGKPIFEEGDLLFIIPDDPKTVVDPRTGEVLPRAAFKAPFPNPDDYLLEY